MIYYQLFELMNKYDILNSSILCADVSYLVKMPEENEVISIILKQLHSHNDLTEFFLELENITLHIKIGGIVWINDGSWFAIETDDTDTFKKWVYYKCPPIPEKCGNTKKDFYNTNLFL